MCLNKFLSSGCWVYTPSGFFPAKVYLKEGLLDGALADLIIINETGEGSPIETKKVLVSSLSYVISDKDEIEILEKKLSRLVTRGI